MYFTSEDIGLRLLRRNPRWLNQSRPYSIIARLHGKEGEFGQLEFITPPNYITSFNIFITDYDKTLELAYKAITDLDEYIAKYWADRYYEIERGV